MYREVYTRRGVYPPCYTGSVYPPCYTGRVYPPELYPGGIYPPELYPGGASLPGTIPGVVYPSLVPYPGWYIRLPAIPGVVYTPPCYTRGVVPVHAIPGVVPVHAIPGFGRMVPFYTRVWENGALLTSVLWENVPF